METGIAINNAASQQFLDCCEIVSSYRVRDNIIEFDFDESLELNDLPPVGVYFDPDCRDADQVHAHLCLNCDNVVDLISIARNECEEMSDHDFALCAECAKTTPEED